MLVTNAFSFYLTLSLSPRYSDKTVRVWRWVAGSGYREEPFSPLLGHRYGVTSVRVSPKVSSNKMHVAAVHRNTFRYWRSVGYCSSSSRYRYEYRLRFSTAPSSWYVRARYTYTSFALL